MFLFWFICIFLQNDWRCNRSIYLSTNILKIIRKCACAAWLWELVKGAGMYPIFINERRFWYLLCCCCGLIIFFWQVEHSGSLWRVCACCGFVRSLRHGESTATWLCFPWWEARNEVSEDFWAKKSGIFPCEIVVSVSGSGEEETAWHSRIFHCD